MKPDEKKRTQGTVRFRTGDDVTGALVSSGDVRRAGARDLARALDQDPRDLFVAAAFAGMIARNEVRVGPTIQRTWADDDAMREVPGWDVRAIAACTSPEPIERAIAAVLAPPTDGDATPPLPYREGPPEQALLLAATPLSDAWKAAWSAAKLHADEDGAPREGDDDGGYASTRARLHDWLETEPAFYDAILELADEYRAEPRRKPKR